MAPAAAIAPIAAEIIAPEVLAMLGATIAPEIATIGGFGAGLEGAGVLGANALFPEIAGAGLGVLPEMGGFGAGLEGTNVFGADALFTDPVGGTFLPAKTPTGFDWQQMAKNFSLMNKGLNMMSPQQAPQAPQMNVGAANPRPQPMNKMSPYQANPYMQMLLQRAMRNKLYGR